MLSLLASCFIADPVDDGPLVTSPVAGVPYTLDLAWGPASTDPAAANSVVVACAGADIDTTYAVPYHGHRVEISGYVQIDMGWSPNGKPVWLSGVQSQCAVGFWRITFPATGSYTLTITDENSNTVGTVSVTVSALTPAPTVPAWNLLCEAPMGRQPARIGTLSFTGGYPESGLDVSGFLVGCSGIFFADITPQPPYQWSWNADKLHMYNASGEITAGAPVDFTCTALFIGGAP